MTWECLSNCGKCCQGIPIPLATFNRNRKKIQRPIFFQVETSEPAIRAYTEDGSCVFKNKENRCAIYKERPIICRRYGTEQMYQCPYITPEGKRRTRDESKPLLDNNEYISRRNFITVVSHYEVSEEMVRLHHLTFADGDTRGEQIWHLHLGNKQLKTISRLSIDLLILSLYLSQQQILPRSPV